MGTYLEFRAKPGCEDQLNAAYAAMTGKPEDWLVYSEKIILSEIAWIHSPKGERQAHLRRFLRTVNDWEKCFPVLKVGYGRFKLSGIEEEEAERIATIKRDIKFILEHRMLFRLIDGLDYAREYDLCDFSGADLIEDHRAKKRPASDDPQFADLPIGKCEVYRLCVGHARPDLWKAYVEFKQSPNDDSWKELRNKVVPWLGMMTTVWQQMERWATRRDGLDYGLMGRFRDGTVPTQFQLRAALREPRTKQTVNG